MQASEIDYQQLLRLVQWLDEERQRAQAQVERLAGQVQQLLGADGARAQAIAAVEADVRRVRGLDQRLGHVEQGQRDLLEPVAGVRLQVDTLTRDLEQQVAVRDVGFERLQRKLDDLDRAMERMRTTDAQLSERLSGVADEARRDRALLPEHEAQLGELRHMLVALSGRTALGEEDTRRLTTLVSDVERAVESLQREQERQREALQLQGLQTQRRFADMEEHAVEWYRAASDARALAQAARGDTQATAVDLAELHTIVDLHAERVTEHTSALDTIRAHQVTLMHEVAALRVEAVTDRERIREIGVQSNHLPPQIEAVSRQAHELADHVAVEREHGQRLEAVAQRLEHQLADLDERYRRALREVRAELAEARQAVDLASRENADLAQRLQQRLGELRHLEEQHRQRQIAELEHQLQELQDHSGPAQAKVETT